MKGICKALWIKERQLRNKKRKHRKPGRLLRYVIISESPCRLRLLNGTELRQPIADVPLFVSKTGKVYSLTQQGLRERRVNFTKKRNYCKKLTTGRGHHQGQAYPRVPYRSNDYPMHKLMALAWKDGIGIGKVVDHINGDIDNFSFENIRVIEITENNWCGGILRRLRNAARKHNLPYMDPARRTPDDMLDLFKRFKGRDIKEAMEEEIERQKVLYVLRRAGLHPERMSKDEREAILAKYRVANPTEIMEYEMTHHMEV